MIYMITIVYFFTAIITFTILPFVLTFNVTGSVIALRTFFKAPAFALVFLSFLWILVPPISVVFSYFLFVIFSPFAFFVGNFLFVFFAVTFGAFSSFLLVLMIPAPRLFYQSFFVVCVVFAITIPARLILAFFATAHQSIVSAFITMEEFWRRLLFYMAYSTEFSRRFLSAMIVATNEPAWLIGNVAIGFVIVLRNLSPLTAAAVAVTVWNFINVWDIIWHISISFLDVGHAPGRSSVAGAFSCLNYTTNTSATGVNYE